MAETKTETTKPESFAEGAKAIGDKLLYELSYKVVRTLPRDIQNLQVEMCGHLGEKYPHSSCHGVRDAVIDTKWR